MALTKEEEEKVGNHRLNRVEALCSSDGLVADSPERNVSASDPFLVFMNPMDA